VPELLEHDLEHVFRHTSYLWEGLRGRRLFLTGGTGFFGCWLLESFLHANKRLVLDASVVVLTRDPKRFRRKAAHLACHPAVSLVEGEVQSFAFPPGPFAWIIHAATDVRGSGSGEQSLSLLDTIVQGTRRALEFARHCGAHRFLLTSSGAVYGRQAPTISQVGEDHPGAPDVASQVAAYGEGKRLAELLCTLYARRYGLQTKVARAFAFTGPYLPLDGGLAVGDFIRDGLAGRPIRVAGDGTALRSYLYAADLAIWLWTILVRAPVARPYNVGSPFPCTIRELADIVARHFGTTVEVGGVAIPGRPPERYLPSVARAEAELGLHAWVPLTEAVTRTATWHQRQARRAA
jgi:dTDP-glucose 4,6-dehydratase